VPIHIIHIHVYHMIQVLDVTSEMELNNAMIQRVLRASVPPGQIMCYSQTYIKNAKSHYFGTKEQILKRFLQFQKGDEPTVKHVRIF